MRVLGLKKWTLVRVFFVLRETAVFTAFATLDAFFPAPPFGFSPSAAGAFFSAFDLGAMDGGVLCCRLRRNLSSSLEPAFFP